MSESHVEEVSKAAKHKMVEVLGVDEGMASIFYNHMYRSIEDVARTRLEDFLLLPGMSKDYLTPVHEKARTYVASVASGTVPASAALPLALVDAQAPAEVPAESATPLPAQTTES